ncbi:MAG: single-stranded DNA-binding protein [Verrucomicrobiota bacterium]|nr:single-stranded DNA-binding protein [Verrucomicrobiota bacterium]
MASFNKVILMGNLTRDPEMRVTPNGHSICKLGLAVSRTFSTRDGERREETAFVDIDAFGKQAEVIAKYMRKGRPIMVEGRLKFDQWESNEGQKRTKLGVVLENFQFLGSRDDNLEGYGNSSPPERAQSNAADATPAPHNEDALDEDVPF